MLPQAFPYKHPVLTHSFSHLREKEKNWGEGKRDNKIRKKYKDGKSKGKEVLGKKRRNRKEQGGREKIQQHPPPELHSFHALETDFPFITARSCAWQRTTGTEAMVTGVDLDR